MTILVILGRLALDPVWGRQHNRHLVFLPTVMLAAWFGGFGPGLLSVALSTLALGHFWTESASGFHVNSDLVLFFFVSVAVCELVESLHLARAHADDARRAHERVMEVVVHDLRNPLTAIKATSEGLQGNPGLDAHHRQRLRIIDRSVSRMESLIRDLVDAGQAERGSLLMMIEKENALSIVEEAIELHTPLARERGVTLQSSGSDGTIFVYGDRHRLLQVLGNLIGNALRFTPEGGRITVRLEAESDIVSSGSSWRTPAGGSSPSISRTCSSSTGKGTPRERGWDSTSPRASCGRTAATSASPAQPGRGASFSFTIPRPP